LRLSPSLSTSWPPAVHSVLPHNTTVTDFNYSTYSAATYLLWNALHVKHTTLCTQCTITYKVASTWQRTLTKVGWLWLLRKEKAGLV